MRILFCTDTYPPQVNGVSVVTALSVQGLRARGWECAVIAPRYPRSAGGSGDLQDAEPLLMALSSFPLPRYPDVRVAVPRLRRVTNAIAAFKPDIVHCATEFVVGRLGARAAGALQIPRCTSYHTDFQSYMSAYGLPWFAGAVSRSVAAFHQGAARVFTPSDAARASLLASGLVRAEVWGRGVDAVRFNPARRTSAVRLRYGLGDAFTFLYVGRLAAEKRIDTVLDAFAAVEQAMPAGSVRLVIAGSGPLHHVLERRGSPTVRFIGNVDHARELPAIYASADAFVMASTTETLGLTALEAMASGKPVIGTLAGGVADYLVDGENGLAFPAGDAVACAGRMLEIANQPALLSRLAAGARRTAERRSWEQELDRLDLSYREVLERSGTPSRGHDRRSGSRPYHAA